ncbi:MAG: preprotein translocase subunit SecG [Ilyomonas sp.]
MTILFFILIVLACVILALIVLIQNPKGGGLSGSIAGFNNQFMGVKQTNDVLEKGTWLFAGIIGVLCMVSTLFFKGAENKGPGTNILQQMPTAPATQQAAPGNAVPFSTDTTKP